MRYIRYAFFFVIGLCLILLALANRQMVTLNVLPHELSGAFGISESITLPLFLVILLGVLIGLMIGFIWEWMREYKQRRELGAKAKQVRGLEREVEKLKAKAGEEKDDVLALLK
ncbi:DUF1049 domain-containing protein [Amylibacter kogurei]|uniref:DUF1049 domain-containing protein n=1 Tax=Paramylibacter kogurei TaxID=1889778 RepID=A0A2G5K4P0_9RHOB|nr:LapA family protein [Amylibacter kogurei]PIB23983.1 DUF1049 domain-containing protein [Amylibacter kogurei]